jgi:arsenite methyltransferase
METTEKIKEAVRKKYSEIATQTIPQNGSSCCGAGGCSTDVYNIMTDDYSKVDGYVSDADLALGCGIPTQYANIKEGDVVVDLGSGAGNDCFVARSIVGETGKVIGIDFTEPMIAKARANAEKLNFRNVEFRLGDIENMPVASDVADVVLSNCVLNLVPNKKRAFAEIFRILKTGGHFSISDIVLKGELPEKMKAASEMYAGCVSGAVQKDEYLEIIQKAGFQNVRVEKEKEIIIPDDILLNYISAEEAKAYKGRGMGIFSVTVYAEKPKSCCSPTCCS